MFGMNRARQASLTVEISLTVVLASLTLIMILGLFSEQLRTMASDMSFKRLFSKNSATGVEKTAPVTYSQDPTASQINVQVVAEQGLDTYYDAVQDRLNFLTDLKDPLTPAQQVNLAECVTLKSIMHRWNNGFSAPSSSELALCVTNGITATTTLGGSIKVPVVKNEFINWDANIDNDVDALVGTSTDLMQQQQSLLNQVKIAFESAEIDSTTK